MVQFKSDWRPIQDKFHSIVNVTEPESLFHYTSLNGLIGIFETQHMRASHRYYLNDQNDILHGIKFSEQIVSDWMKHSSGKKRDLARNILEILTDEKSKVANSPFTFSVSFSEKKEGAAQWQVYGDYGRGVMIEFNYDKLKCSARVGIGLLRWQEYVDNL